MNPLAVRYVASFVLILLGVGMVALVLSGGLDDDSSASSEIPTIGVTAKGTAADCPFNWRFIDNPQDRYTLCLPRNLLHYDGTLVTDLDAVGETWPASLEEFALVNSGWLAQVDPNEPRPENPAVAPLSLRIEVVGVDFQLEDCDPRLAEPSSDGVVRCTTSYDDLENPTFTTEATFHRLNVLIPTLKDRSTSEVFSVSLTLDGYSVDWPAQAPMFDLIIDSITPY